MDVSSAWLMRAQDFRLVRAATSVHANLLASRGDLGVAGIPMRYAPGQLRGNAHEWMQNHKDALECAAIGFHERFARKADK